MQLLPPAETSGGLSCFRRAGSKLVWKQHRGSCAPHSATKTSIDIKRKPSEMLRSAVNSLKKIHRSNIAHFVEYKLCFFARVRLILMGDFKKNPIQSIYIHYFPQNSWQLFSCCFPLTTARGHYRFGHRYLLRPAMQKKKKKHRPKQIWRRI